NLPQILSAGKTILKELISGITSMLGNLGESVSKIASKIIDGVKKLPSEMVKWGKDMIQGLIDGIKNMIGKVGDAVKGIADKITSFLHFSKPDEGSLREYESWMPDFIDGLTNSLKKSAPTLMNEVQAITGEISDAMNLDGNISATVTGSETQRAMEQANMVEAFKEALYQVKIEMDDEEMGRFVDKTVTRLVYT
ncbi:hypothetical protein, partial [Methanobrevibacter sp.]|uniref:phage tail protein n=1 Tax=Methanobrevibacter sp. TaxID=66852 RepID=UPI00388FC6A9